MILQLLYPPVIFAIHDVTHLTVCAMQLHVSEFTYLLGNPDGPDCVNLPKYEGFYNLFQ